MGYILTTLFHVHNMISIFSNVLYNLIEHILHIQKQQTLCRQLYKAKKIYTRDYRGVKLRNMIKAM